MSCSDVLLPQLRFAWQQGLMRHSQLVTQYSGLHQVTSMPGPLQGALREGV